jgi:hypothetical protein
LRARARARQPCEFKIKDEMMFVKLTNLDGLKVYINMIHVNHFMADDGGTHITAIDDFADYDVKETPEEIMKLMEKK